MSDDVDRYAWRPTGMRLSDLANGPMRYIREIDYDRAIAERNARIAELKVKADKWDGLLDAARQFFVEHKTNPVRAPDPIEMLRRVGADEAMNNE